MSSRFNRRSPGFLAGCAALMGFSASLLADEPAVPAPSEAAATATEEPSIDELARRLDSDSFDERQNAAEALAARGAEAIPALERVAEEGSREAKSRALDLLALPLQANGENETKTAAKAALERLAKSADAYASRRATEALAPPEPEAPRQALMPQPLLPPGFPQPLPGIRVQAIAQNGNLKIERKNVNGDETIKVEDGERRVEIAKSAAGKIEMSVTEKVDGKEVTEKFAAQDEDDLKTRSPKAHELYKKYADQNRVQIGIGARFPNGLPMIPAPNEGLDSIERRLDGLRRVLDMIQRQEQRTLDQIQALEREIETRKAAEQALPPADVERGAGPDADGGSDD